MRSVFAACLLSLSISAIAALSTTSIGEALNEKNETARDDFHARLEAVRQRVKEQLEKLSASINKTAIEEALEKIHGKVRDHIRETGDSIEEVNDKQHVAGNYYQGDMILTKQQTDLLAASADVSKRQAFVAGAMGYGNKWSTVYYSYVNGIPAHTKKVSELAVKFWQDHTCINFRQDSSAINRVSVFVGDGCYSYVGQTSGAQELSLGQGCDSVGTAAHEWGHALGFHHTQSRHDRDSHITLMERNVKSGWLDQFDRESTVTNNNYGMPYDYGSIMQYEADSASGNQQPTMIARVPQYQDTMGSDIVSFIDVSMMNTLYNCKQKCGNQRNCRNGGFAHPRDCSKCICPSGWGGRFCSERPAGCGTTLNATEQAQTLQHTIGKGARSYQDEYVFCHWMIVAPSSKRIEVTIKHYAHNACTSGCKYGGIELKWKKDMTLTGSRYCCSNDVNEKVLSETSILPVVAYNRYRTDSFTLTYRVV